jgi:hypothetical protein
MNILGIDPGATSGFCVYDADARRALYSGKFSECAVFSGVNGPRLAGVANAVVERPKGYGPTRPAVVDCAYVAGRIVERLCDFNVHELTRIEVKNILRDATHGEVSVKNDAGVWAALKLLHGEGCDKKGGSLYGVTSHARAALAVAVAWGLREAAKGAA